MQCFKILEDNLNYKFKNKALLTKALSHSSYVNKEKENDLQSNERLEFLGDRVLGLVIAEYLFSYFKTEPEGVLSHCIAYLNSSELLYEISKKIALDKCIFIHDIKINSLKKIYANTVEAILAAIYLDSDYETIKNIIINLWKPYITTSLSYDIKINFNPKSFLQEWAQKNKLLIPEYIDLKQEGSEHEPVFYISLKIVGYNEVIATGKSKKIAQKNAALSFIKTNNLYQE
ncbi:ribonuclease III [Rickettsiales bacterium LUAb2]